MIYLQLKIVQIIHSFSNKRTIRKNEIHNLPLEHQTSGIILFNQRFLRKRLKNIREKNLLNGKMVKNAQHDQSVFNVLVGKYYGKFNVLEYDWGHWKILQI